MEVIISKIAQIKIEEIAAFILQKWGLKSKQKFTIAFKEKSIQISNFPYSCPVSEEKKGLYKAVLTKQTTLFYTVNEYKKQIEIILVYDTRQDPNNLIKDFD